MMILRAIPVLLLAACQAAAPAPVDDLADSIRAKHDIPGLAAAVVKGDDIVHVSVAGIRRQDQPDNLITTDDGFHIGSCTKAFTATLAGVMVDEGVLAWDTTIVDLFPEWKDTIHLRFQSITMDELLTHRAGVMEFTQHGEREGEIAAGLSGTPGARRLAFAERVLGEEPLHEPGSKYLYSNAGYAIVATMLERVGKKTWQELIQKRIFEPLSMNASGFGAPAKKATDPQPWGHLFFRERLQMIPPNPVGFLPPTLESAGDINCTIEDFARFAQMHLAGMRGDKTIVTTETMTTLHEPRLENYAMGWVDFTFYGAKASAHNGSAGMFFAWMMVWPEHNLAIVTASNAGNGDAACRELAEKLFEQYVGE